MANINIAMNPFSYKGNDNFNGADTISVTISDQGNTGSGGALTDSGTVAITVNAVNDAPVGTGDSATTNEDVGVTIDVLTNDLDAVESSPLSVTNLTQPTNGTAVLNQDDTITYTGDADFNGSDSFTYTPNDGTDDGNVVTVSITVDPVNDAPVLSVPEAQSATEDTLKSIFGISVSDVDAGNGQLQVSLSVSDGVLNLSTTSGLTFSSGDGSSDASMTFTGTVSNLSNALNGLGYLGNANFNGSDSLSITVSDQGNTGSGGVLTDAETISITVNAVNDAPVGTGDSATTNEDVGVTINVLTNDLDAVESSPLSVTNLTQPTNGTAVLNQDDTITYTGDADFNGSDSFTYTPNDGTDDGNVVTVSITVDPVNDAPVLSVPEAQSATEDTLKSIFGISVSDVDAGNGQLQVSLCLRRRPQSLYHQRPYLLQRRRLQRRFHDFHRHRLQSQ